MHLGNVGVVVKAPRACCDCESSLSSASIVMSRYGASLLVISSRKKLHIDSHKQSASQHDPSFNRPLSFTELAHQL